MYAALERDQSRGFQTMLTGSLPLESLLLSHSHLSSARGRGQSEILRINCLGSRSEGVRAFDLCVIDAAGCGFFFID